MTKGKKIIYNDDAKQIKLPNKIFIKIKSTANSNPRYSESQSHQLLNHKSRQLWVDYRRAAVLTYCTSQLDA